MSQAAFALYPNPPYDFELTAGYLTYFRGRYDTDIFERGNWHRLLDLGERLVLAIVRSTGNVTSPRLEVELTGPNLAEDGIAEARRQVAWILAADGDLSDFYRIAEADPYMARLVRAMYGLHIPHTASVFEALVVAIVGQQISSQVARVVRNLLIDTYGPSMEVAGTTYHAFPRPESLAAAGVEGLRSMKFSQRKAEYVVDIASRIASKGLDLDKLGCNADEVVRTLTNIRGVGPWTAHWLLIRALGHGDGFPHGDLALQRTMGLLVNEGVPMGPQESLEYSQRWSPYRSYVTTYLFAATRSGRTDALDGGDVAKGQ